MRPLRPGKAASAMGAAAMATPSPSTLIIEALIGMNFLPILTEPYP